MSAAIAVVLDAMRIRAFSAVGESPSLDVPWDPSAPQAAVQRVADTFGAPSAIVLIVGLGFLEIARPELPPLAPDARLAMLQRDADRYFPVDSGVAVAWADGFGFAMSASLLHEWVRAFGALAPIEAIVTMPRACAESVASGVWRLDAAVGETGLLDVGDGAIRDVRRVVDPGRSPETPANRDAMPNTDVDLSPVARAVLAHGARATHAQLLDPSLTAQLRRRRRDRVLRSVAVFAAALVALAWSVDRRQERRYQALRQEVAALTSAAAPAQRALLRLNRATTERALLASADSAVRAGSGPAAVLARLGTLLPPDAFVQRLEWNGASWRIDGSASEAPRIVPLLDADPHFADVRIMAASTRFLEAGRQRESFSISFRALVPTGSVRASR